jgi:two-component system chemotaxis response regulator CheB
VQPGHIYVAPQDRHLLLGPGFIRLGTGPRENHVRPAVDPMFRSAALAYGARVVGVIISGLLHDGASGLSAIKQVGGTAVVQHPRDAVADEMPIAALEAVEPDHLARADELGPLLAQIAGSEAGPDRAPDEDLAFEVEVAAGAPYGSAELRRIADPVTLTCPDCQGVLSEVRGARPLRYRCQIGHAFTAGALIAHDDRLSEAIRVAMRVMEERVELVSRMARDARQQGRTAVAQLYESRAEEFGAYAATLRAAARETIRSRPEDGGQAA